MRDSRFKGAFGLRPFRIGMNPLVINGSIRKLVYLLLGNYMPTGYTKLLAQVGFEFGVILNNDHSLITRVFAGAVYKFRRKINKQEGITKSMYKALSIFLKNHL